MPCVFTNPRVHPALSPCCPIPTVQFAVIQTGNGAIVQGQIDPPLLHMHSCLNASPDWPPNDPLTRTHEAWEYPPHIPGCPYEFGGSPTYDTNGVFRYVSTNTVVGGRDTGPPAGWFGDPAGAPGSDAFVRMRKCRFRSYPWNICVIDQSEDERGTTIHSCNQYLAPVTLELSCPPLRHPTQGLYGRGYLFYTQNINPNFPACCNPAP